MKENKIYIIGPCGSGKTTLARKLSKKLGIKNYELDKIVWDDSAGNIKRTDVKIKQLFNDIINGEDWIIEDVGRKIFTEGIRRADIVYYIDLPKFVVYKNCILRWIKQKTGKEKYNYKPSLKSLFEMIKWINQDIKNKSLKLQRIVCNSKKYKILKNTEIKTIKQIKDKLALIENRK